MEKKFDPNDDLGKEEKTLRDVLERDIQYGFWNDAAKDLADEPVAKVHSRLSVENNLPWPRDHKYAHRWIELKCGKGVALNENPTGMSTPVVDLKYRELFRCTDPTCDWNYLISTYGLSIEEIEDRKLCGKCNSEITHVSEDGWKEHNTDY